MNRLNAHYNNISKEFGYQTIPMESYIQPWAYGLSNYDRSDLSIDLFDYNISLRPNSPSAYNLKTDFLINNENGNEAIVLLTKSLSIKEDIDIRKKTERSKV